MLKLNKIKHFSCKNCDCQDKITFENDIIFCFGLIKKTYHPEDYYRYCIIKNKNRNAQEIMEEELHCLLMGLSRLLFLKRLRDINSKKK
jgi:hypothetical protein